MSYLTTADSDAELTCTATSPSADGEFCVVASVSIRPCVTLGATIANEVWIAVGEARITYAWSFTKVGANYNHTVTVTLAYGEREESITTTSSSTATPTTVSVPLGLSWINRRLFGRYAIGTYPQLALSDVEQEDVEFPLTIGTGDVAGTAHFDTVTISPFKLSDTEVCCVPKRPNCLKLVIDGVTSSGSICEQINGTHYLTLNESWSVEPYTLWQKTTPVPDEAGEDEDVYSPGRIIKLDVEYDVGEKKLKLTSSYCEVVSEWLYEGELEDCEGEEVGCENQTATATKVYGSTVSPIMWGHVYWDEVPLSLVTDDADMGCDWSEATVTVTSLYPQTCPAPKPVAYHCSPTGSTPAYLPGPLPAQILAEISDMGGSGDCCTDWNGSFAMTLVEDNPQSNCRWEYRLFSPPFPCCTSESTQFGGAGNMFFLVRTLDIIKFTIDVPASGCAPRFVFAMGTCWANLLTSRTCDYCHEYLQDWYNKGTAASWTFDVPFLNLESLVATEGTFLSVCTYGTSTSWASLGMCSGPPTIKLTALW